MKHLAEKLDLGVDGRGVVVSQVLYSQVTSPSPALMVSHGHGTYASEPWKRLFRLRTSSAAWSRACGRRRCRGSRYTKPLSNSGSSAKSTASSSLPRSSFPVAPLHSRSGPLRGLDSVCQRLIVFPDRCDVQSLVGCVRTHGTPNMRSLMPHHVRTRGGLNGRYW